MAKILRGDIVADKIITDLANDLKGLKAKDIKPTLAVILIGDNPASKIYVKAKQNRVEGLGLGFNLYEFLPIASSKQVIELIERLNEADHIDGILVQLPLPYRFSKNEILKKINPSKDIDSLTKNSKYKSPTAKGILELLNFYKIPIKNKKVVVIGKGGLVGRPFSEIAKEQGAEVIDCDQKTKNLSDITKKADIIVSAAGQPKLVTVDMVGKSSIVIDAGTAVEKGLQVGDIDFIKVAKKVKAITPSMGGVGPVTIACLISNLVAAAKNRKKS